MDCEKVVESDFDKILEHLRCLNIHLKMRSEDTVKRYLKFDKYFRLVAFVVLQYGIENPSLFPNARAEGYKSAMRIHLANGSWVFWCGDIDTKSNTYWTAVIGRGVMFKIYAPDMWKLETAWYATVRTKEGTGVVPETSQCRLIRAFFKRGISEFNKHAPLVEVFLNTGTVVSSSLKQDTDIKLDGSWEFIEGLLVEAKHIGAVLAAPVLSAFSRKQQYEIRKEYDRYETAYRCLYEIFKNILSRQKDSQYQVPKEVVLRIVFLVFDRMPIPPG
jgi:hypothetical protein